MSRKTQLENYKGRIDNHLSNELDIMRDLLKAKLTNEEWTEIVSFIRDHPTAKFNQWVREIEKKRKEV